MSDRAGPSTLTREERLERKLAKARDERDRWQRRHAHLVAMVQGLERRRAWVERYYGFRLEYRLRGAHRHLRRLWRKATR